MSEVACLKRKKFPERVQILNGVKHYPKEEGMRLAMEFLSEACPFTDVQLVRSTKEWENIRQSYDERMAFRVDVPMGQTKKLQRIDTTGVTAEVSQVLLDVQRVCPDAAVLVMKTKEESIPRYLYDGGFSIVFDYRNEIVIELVGKGFDGSELTHGLAVHEIWKIPWGMAEEICRGHDDVGLVHTVVSPEDYQRQRAERLRMLCDGAYVQCSRSEAEAAIPEEYVPAKRTRLLRNLFDGVVMTLLHRLGDMRMADWRVFGAQGNFVNRKPEAWEIFLPGKRWS